MNDGVKIMKRTNEINNLAELKSISLSNYNRAQYKNLPIDFKFEALCKAFNMYGTSPKTNMII